MLEIRSYRESIVNGQAHEENLTHNIIIINSKTKLQEIKIICSTC